MAVRRTVVLLTLLALVLSGCVAGADPKASARSDPDVLVLALQPSKQASTLEPQAEALRAFLEERMRAHGHDYKLKVVFPESYEAVIQGIRTGSIDGALLPAWPAAAIQEKTQGTIRLAEAREVIIDDEHVVMTSYYSYFIVRKDSPYQTVDELRGKSIAFPSKTSTSGYLFPLASLVDAGLVRPGGIHPSDPASFFGDVQFAGSYRLAYEALRDGKVDAAVTAGDVNAELFKTIREDTRIIATQGPIPAHAVVFGGHVSSEVDEALSLALMDLRENPSLMRDLGSATFVAYEPASTDEYLNNIRYALKRVGMPLDMVPK